MGCKKLFPLCLLGSSPIQSSSEPRSSAHAGTEVMGMHQGRLSFHLLASAHWSIRSMGSARFSKVDKFWLVSHLVLSMQMKKALKLDFPVSSMNLMPYAMNEPHLQL